MKMKKTIAGMLAAVTLVSSAAVSSFAAAPKFSDVSSNAWYAPAVSVVASHGMVNGSGGTKFDPNTNMTRAMLVQILYNHAEKPAVNRDSTFTDVKEGAWYYDAVQWAAKNGVVSGVGDNKFAPETSITREQYAVILYRYYEKTGTSPKVDMEMLKKYSDQSSISSWAHLAMGWAVTNGIMNGTDEGKLLPQSTATRAQAAQMLSNYLEISQRGHVYSPKVIKQATDTEDGIMRYTCSICNHSYDKPIKAGTKHAYSVTQSKDPTCTEDGFKTYICQDCGDKYTETVPATGHDYAVNVIDGVKITSCSKCDYHHEEPVSTEGHSYVKVVTKEPTCEMPGNVKYTCTICGDTYTDITPGPIGHNYVVIDTLEPECLKPGSTKYECKNCGRRYAKRIKETGHDYVWDAANKKMVCSKCGDTVYADN